jgi:hypothetical protein
MKYMLFTDRDPSVQLDPDERPKVPAAVAARCLRWIEPSRPASAAGRFAECASGRPKWWLTMSSREG